MKKDSSVERVLSKLDRPMTVDQLANIVFLDRHHLGKMLRRLQTNQVVHVCGWDKNGYPRPIWMAGLGVNKPKPKPKTRAAASRDYRKRLKATQSVKIKVRPDIAASWIV